MSRPPDPTAHEESSVPDSYVTTFDTFAADAGRPAHPAAPAVAAQPLTTDGVPADWQPGDRILDLVEVKALLSTGGMSQVHHREWNMDLAVKSPQPEIFANKEGKANFIREAETWITLGLHPQIVTCYYVLYPGRPPAYLHRIRGRRQWAWGRPH